MKIYFVGIDFSADTFNAAILRKRETDEKRELLSEGKFSNDTEGVSGLFEWIESFFMAGETFSSVLLCGEDTGTYSRLLPYSCASSGVDFWLQNPLSIKNGRGDIQRKKDDRADALAIAEYAYTFREKAKIFKPASKAVEELREAHSYRKYLVTERAAKINRLKDEMRKLKARPDSKVLKSNIKSLKQLKKVLDKEIKDIDKMMLEIVKSDKEVKEVYNVIRSITGIGPVTAVTLIVVTNSFTRFESSRQLASYFGVAPFPKQSGTMNMGNHRSRFADPYLASLLTMGARAAIRHDSKMGAYAARLFAKNKHYLVVINNVRYKLLKYAFACATRRMKYEPNHTDLIFKIA